VAAPDLDDVPTFNAFLRPGGLYTIDYVFARGAEALSHETIDDDYGVSYISDHYPILAVLDCPACG